MKSLQKELFTLFTNQSGTLLLETVIASMIFLTLFPLMLYKSVLLYEHIQLEQFVQSLDPFLNDAQITAITEKRNVYVDFNETKHTVMSYYTIFSPIKTLSAPSSVHFQKGSLSLLFHFSTQGTINQAGTFFISSRSESYQITYLLGQGRFYVKKV